MPQGSYHLTTANVDANGCYKGPPVLDDPNHPWQGDIYIDISVNFCNGGPFITGTLYIGTGVSAVIANSIYAGPQALTSEQLAAILAPSGN